MASIRSGASWASRLINVQAFASRGAENRRIYDVLDDFQSRKPIDVTITLMPASDEKLSRWCNCLEL